jgi:hypothetical protein
MLGWVEAWMGAWVKSGGWGGTRCGQGVGGVGGGLLLDG